MAKRMVQLERGFEVVEFGIESVYADAEANGDPFS